MLETKPNLQREFEEDETRYNQLFELIPDGLVIYVDLKIVDINQAGVKLLGATNKAEIIDRPIFDFVHSDYNDAVKSCLEQLPHQQKPTAWLEQKLVRVDGQTTQVITIAQPTVFQNKFAIQTVLRDISGYRQVEEQVRQSEQKYQTLVEQLPAITYILEFQAEKSEVVYISPQIESILGFTQKEWIETPDILLKHIHPEDKARCLQMYQKRHMAGVDSLAMEYRLIARNGKIVWFRNQTTYIRDKSGQLRYSHGVMFDITGEKQLEAQFLQAQRMETAGQLAGGIAHNFNNALTTLIGHTELAMLALPNDHEVYADLQSIRKSAQRVASLTQQMLTFSRHQPIQPKLLNLNHLIVAVESLLEQLVTDPIKLEISLKPNLMDIRADPNQIKQLLFNLISNSCDAMPNGGQLIIKTEQVLMVDYDHFLQVDVEPGDYVVLNVTDTGMGMSQQVMRHIFEPFYTTKPIGQGTGLGLSTCFGIVKQGGGHITVDSDVGQGTVFRVYWPHLNEVPECRRAVKV